MLSACTDLHSAFAVLCSLHAMSEVSVGCFCCIVWSSHFAVLLNVRYSSARLEFPVGFTIGSMRLLMVSLVSAVAMAIVLFCLPGITGLVSVTEMPKTDSARVAASYLERTRFRFNPYSEWHVHGTKERSTLNDPHKEDQSELVGYVGNTLQLHSGPKFSEIFAAAKFFVQNWARSRRNPYRLVVQSLITTLEACPKHLLRASACCAA